MVRSARWVEGDLVKGVIEVKLSSWKYFSDYINQEMLDYTSYVYRGQGSAAWKLEPSLDRVLKNPKSPMREALLSRFKYETRGRRGAHPPIMATDNDWWALGQHHGLMTPLLDWTESPFVALYFAAESALRANSSHFSVCALFQVAINKNNDVIVGSESVKLINGRKPTVKIVRPLSDENSRLVNQRGLFTRGPNNVDMESWIRIYNHQPANVMELIKITVPTKGVQDCLRYLNRMNINHSTLFPDLIGASEYCNQYLKINKY
ncbi:FRG domain-containing protein [uncultured Pseudomonas sp.]|uniref:FRG domain-containing protein n=1 Tax=uncultured Pseudomonas sp. TaxID=114707 RepID=UPI0025DA294A|nr:FRG domain-containing protein [uncultured Pseudomonas sp.]